MNAQLLIEGRWQAGETSFDVLDKFTGQPFAVAERPSLEQAERAVAGLAKAARQGSPSAYARSEALMKASQLVNERREDFISLMAKEAGFPRRDAEGEIARTVQTLSISAEEAKRLQGEMIPIEGAPSGAGRFAFTLRVPVGVVCAITPFNAPLNTVAHKVAPALAAGNALLLKPSGKTPLTACRLVEILVEAGVPETFLAVLHDSGGEVASQVIANPAIRFITFTGSTGVGRSIQAQADLRRTQLELGSIAATICCADADVEKAVPKIAGASFRKAGQVCTSIQLLYVHEMRLQEVTERLVTTASALRVGDPSDPATEVGPLISKDAALRVEATIAEAKRDGARVLCGGVRKNNCITPAVIADTDPAMRIRRDELFGPVVNVIVFSDVWDAVAQVNALPFGLATGVFSRDLPTAFALMRKLEVGGVHINETSSSRVDMMPYGGMKDSGFGREGPRYAAREMTEEKTVTITA